MSQPLHLTFEVLDRFRPFSLIAPGFEVQASDWTEEQGGLVRTTTAPPAPFVTVSAQLSSAGTPVSVGLATSDDEHLLGRWNPAASLMTLELRQSGRSKRLRQRKLDLSGPCQVAFVLCENQATLLVDAGSGWSPVITERSKVVAAVDLCDEEVLRHYRYTWAAPRGGSGTVRAGLFGHVGLRDPHLVQDADGSPYLRNGRLFMTWTSAGLGHFSQAHWSVWSFPPGNPEDMRLEAKLFGGRGGRVLGDHAGHLVRDGDEWHVAVSSWGDFPDGPIHVRHLTTSEDVLAGTHVLRTEPTKLPTRHGTWDPGLMLVDDAWHVSFVESPSQSPFDFHPALARTATKPWTSGLEAVPLAGDFHQCEGPVLVQTRSQPLLLASDRVTRTFPAFAIDGTRVGQLRAPYPTNIPHPQLVPDARGGWFMVTFDGTPFADRVVGYGGHGDVVIMHSV